MEATWIDKITDTEVWSDNITDITIWANYFILEVEVIKMSRAELIIVKNSDNYAMAAGEVKEICNLTDVKLMSIAVRVVANSSFILRIKDEDDVVLEITPSEIYNRLFLQTGADFPFTLQTYVYSSTDGHGIAISLPEATHFDNLIIEVENADGSGDETLNYVIITKRFEYR